MSMAEQAEETRWWWGRTRELGFKPQTEAWTLYCILGHRALILAVGLSFGGFCPKKGEELDGWMNETPSRAASENSMLMAAAHPPACPSISTSIHPECT